jgi:hypothetical protein
MTVRQKITLAEMRASGIRGLLIYCVAAAVISSFLDFRISSRY